MKIFNLALKIVAALAVVAGIVYVVATYGDKIVAWAKGLWAKFGCCCNTAPEEVDGEEIIDVDEAIPAEETPEAEAAEETIQEEDFENE